MSEIITFDAFCYDRETQYESDVWNTLLSYVTTPFVYVARDVVHMTNATQLLGLLDDLIYNEATVAASSWRTLITGKVCDARCGSVSHVCCIKPNVVL